MANRDKSFTNDVLVFATKVTTILELDGGGELIHLLGRLAHLDPDQFEDLCNRENGLLDQLEAHIERAKERERIWLDQRGPPPFPA